MSRRRIKSSKGHLYQSEELIFRRRKKNPEINYTLDELVNFSQDKFFFLSMILQNDWMKAIYLGKQDYDRKLHFIRTWYNAKSEPQKEEPKNDKPNQPTLF